MGRNSYGTLKRGLRQKKIFKYVIDHGTRITFCKNSIFVSGQEPLQKRPLVLTPVVYTPDPWPMTSNWWRSWAQKFQPGSITDRNMSLQEERWKFKLEITQERLNMWTSSFHHWIQHQKLQLNGMFVCLYVTIFCQKLKDTLNRAVVRCTRRTI